MVRIFAVVRLDREKSSLTTLILVFCWDVQTRGIFSARCFPRFGTVLVNVYSSKGAMVRSLETQAVQLPTPLQAVSEEEISSPKPCSSCEYKSSHSTAPSLSESCL